jgi:hypothetical protein
MNQVLVNDDARLLTQVAPFVFVDDAIALKGDTAINLFVRDMSRLSVDLDPIFADYNLPRDEALGRTPLWARPRLARTGMFRQIKEVHVMLLARKLTLERGGN